MPESTAGPDGTRVFEVPDPWVFQRWAFEQETGSVARKAVLSMLAMMADTTTGRCEARQATLAKGVELSERAVRGHLATLTEMALIARRPQFRRDGRRRGDEYLMLAPWVVEWPDGQGIGQPADSSGGQIDRRNGASGHDRNEGSGYDRNGASGQELPLKNGHLGTEPSSSARGTDDSLGIPEEMQVDVEQMLRAKTKVGGRLVTRDEMRTAAAALAEFNRQAESDFGLGANLTCVVMRVRERPSWDASKHRRLVESAWRVKWWERRGGQRRPTPQVIYGNSRVFEQVAQDAADEAAGRLQEVVLSLKERRFSDGRTWDELTPAEQETAKANAAMDVWPEDLQARRDAPVPALAASNGHGALTAETFAADE